MKRYYNIFITIWSVICCTLLMQSAASAAVISDIKPTRNVGIFEKGDLVAFTVSLNDLTEDIDGLFEVRNLDDKLIRTGAFTLLQNAQTVKVELGEFNPGWYRVKFFELKTGEELTDIYTAFSVTEKYATRTKKETPFAVDQAGNGIFDANGKAAHAEALKLMGVNFARERAYWSRWESDYKVIADTTAALESENVNCLEVWNNSLVDWDGNLLDVYNMQKNYAYRFKDEVDAWEIWNEPDNDDTIMPDLYSAFYKAAALGVIDADSSLIKTFGGLCTSGGLFRNTMLANDVLDYADVYNVHSHRTGDSDVYHNFVSEIAENGVRLSTIYSDGRPIWVTESGMFLPINEKDNLVDNLLKTQAEYVITSTVESFDAAGTDKHFFFLARHYIENNQELGMFSANDMPYPSTAAYAALTYHLGEAKYKGELKRLPEGVKGFMFNTGEHDAAVIWSTGDESYVQLKTEDNVTIVNLVGEVKERRYGAYHNLVNIPVSKSPVIVKFNGNSDTDNYFKKEFPTYTKNTSDAKKVILQPIWKDVSTQRQVYVLNHGKTYDITVNVYNFSDTEQSGYIHADADKLNIENSSISFSVGAKSSTSVAFRVALAEDVLGGEYGKLKFSSENSEVSPSVGVYMRDISEIEISNDEITYFGNFWWSGKWTKYTNATRSSISSNWLKSSVTFSHEFGEGVKWSYPIFEIQKGTLFGSTGLVFDHTVDALDGTTVISVMVYTDEVGYDLKLSEFKEGTTRVVIPWEMFNISSSDEKLDVSKIKDIRIGMIASSNTPPDYTISNFGYYTKADVTQESVNLTIKGIDEGRVYPVGSKLSASANVLAGELFVYLNFEPYYDFEVIDDQVFINLNNLDEGAYNLLVSYKDEFNTCEWTEKNFYIGVKSREKGSFY